MADTISSAIKIPELSSSPSNPLAGYQAIYAKTDNKLYMRTSGGVETELTNVAGSGIGTLNTLTATTQTFATGSSGTDFNIVSSTSTHTFNIPDASLTNRGLVTTGTQSITGAKSFFGTVYVGNTLTVEDAEIESYGGIRILNSSGSGGSLKFRATNTNVVDIRTSATTDA